jgi:hypothetical protein
MSQPQSKSNPHFIWANLCANLVCELAQAARTNDKHQHPINPYSIINPSNSFIIVDDKKYFKMGIIIGHESLKYIRANW